MKKITTLGILFLAATPFLASAQNLTPFVSIIEAVGTIVNLLIPILVGVAIIVFFWGLIKYIRESGKGHEQGRNIMIAGLVSLFVMVCLYGIINFAAGALNISGNNTATVPVAPKIPAQR